MQWQDEGILLALRRHGEGSAVAEIFTRGHGRHLGLMRGARRESALLQPGNSVVATWRARLAEHLGFWRFEPLHVRTGALIDNAPALAALRALCAVLALVVPEREPHPALYAALEELLDTMAGRAAFEMLLLRFELKLLEDLGYGLGKAETEAILSLAARDVGAGLARTAEGLERHLLHPHGHALPAARAGLAETLARAKMARGGNHAPRS
jgi:DNA repair protein RecO (recombination protein O)